MQMITKNILYCAYFLSFLLKIDGVTGSKTYSIIAPDIVRPNDNYNVIVSLNGVKDTTQVNCTLAKIKSKDDNSLSSISVPKTFKPSESLTQLIELKIGTGFTAGDYKLTVVGSGGLDFNQTFDVRYVYKQFVILVQSDKAIYKPGQDVKFRVLILDFTLKPIKEEDIEDMKIFMMDPEENRLQMFIKNSKSLDQSIHGINRFNYSKGVTNDLVFSLSDRATNGEWMIQTLTHGQMDNYTFYVEDYVLPLANVTINVPKNIFLDNSTIEYKIDCFYTFGKPVKGSVELILSKIDECGKKIENGTKFSIKHTINGQLEDHTNLKDIQILGGDCTPKRINVTAVITDDITKSIYTNYETIYIYRTPLIAHQLSKQKYFKPGKMVRIKAKVQSIDGKQISNEVIENLKVSAIFSYKNQTKNNVVIDLIMRNANFISFDIPTNRDTQYLTFNVIHKGENILIKNTMTAFSGCKNEFIQVMLQEPLTPLVAGKVINLSVRSNEPIKNLVYYLVVRGNIINQSHIINNNSDSIVLPILLTREMVPQVVVAVYTAVQDSGVILSDSVTLYVSGLFHNEVKFNVKTPLVDASQKSSFAIEAEPGSQLFLLGVDEAVLALRRGNDIDANKVIDVLDDGLNNEDYSTNFLPSGMSFKSNADEECKTFYDIEEVKDDEDVDIGKSVTIRKDFRETWIWDRVQMPNGKSKINLASKVPDSMTSWRLTAFAIHEDNGLGLTQLAGHVTVFRPFFIKLNLPFSIKRDETSELHILAFNYLNETANVNIQIILNETDKEKFLTLNNCLFNFKMEPNQIKNLTCEITAHEVGNFNLLAKAEAVTIIDTKIDREVKQLQVVYEGVRKQASKTILFDFTKDNDKILKDIIKIEYPDNAINGSQRVYGSATSELITSTWKDSINSSINSKMIKADIFPVTGCCQQRTVIFYPQIYRLEFLEASKKNETSVTEKALASVQRAINWLCFQNPSDGSFISWEWHDYNGHSTWNDNQVKAEWAIKSSTWMTAYSLILMNHAKYHVNVDSNSIEKTKKWLNDQQLESGEFDEKDVAHIVISTSNFKAYLTSYVYIAMNSDPNKIVKNDKAINFLAKIFKNLTHPLDSTITCYALHIANHDLQNECFDKLIKSSILNNEMRFWNGTDDIHSLQTTAYGLMILVQRKSHTNALQVLKYLLSKQLQNGFFNNMGAVTDSLTTVLCIEAMTKLIVTLDQYDPKLESIIIDFNSGHKIYVKPENEVQQSLELDENTKEVELKASGYGRALARVYWEYNVKENSGKHIDITASKTQNSGDEHINIDVCAKYKSDDIVRNAIIEIDLPSGYKYDGTRLTNISDTIDHIEYVNSETHINVYLRELTQKPVCISIPAIQTHKVSNLKSSTIKSYPYYDRSKESVYHFEFLN